MIEQIRTRRSIRKYLNNSVDDKTIEAVLESGRLAPSGSNTQPWHFIVIRDRQIKEQVARVSHDQKWMLTAPVFIACAADIRSRVTTPEGLNLTEESPQFELKQIIRDTAIAVEHMVLEATNLGLGTCWVAWFKQEEIRPILAIPNDKYLVAVLTLGYSAEDPKQRTRKDLKAMVHYDTW